VNILDDLESQGYRASDKHCAWCGKFWGGPLDYRGRFPTCQACVEDEMYKKRALFLVKESAEPLEERFAGLFKAARVLLDEGADEDQIFPTLAWEALQTRNSDQGTQGGQLAELKASFLEAWMDPETWELKARELLERTGRIRPVKVVDGVLILERAPAAVKCGAVPSLKFGSR
jgi:hypothetical protein